MPSLIIITGSNGAGKSSIGPQYLPTQLRDKVFDGDKLFMQKKNDLWIQGLRLQKELRNQAADYIQETFNELVKASLENNTDFVYEGHFTRDEQWEIPKKFKAAGYKIKLFFFGLKDTELSELRVVARTSEGGHYVNTIEIYENFYGNLNKLDQHFGIFDSIRIFDTSGIEHIELAQLKSGIPTSAISHNELPDWFADNLVRISELILEQEKQL